MPSAVKALPVAHIIHTSTHPYEIITINGMPFYQSSGNSSAFANTWFPFFGLLEKSIGVYPTGYFLKAFSTELPQNVVQRIRQLFPSYGSANAGEQLPLRFWRLPCLLISSTLGGGLWNTDAGRQLKAFLQQQYPAYYQAEPRLAIKPATARLTEPNAVNTWLCRQAKVNNIKALASKYPKTANELVSLFQPARRQVKIAELDTLNGERLFELREELKRKQRRAAPKRQDQEKPLTRFLAKKTNQPARKVNFAELDTANGKRLFNLRNQLRQEQKRPAPVRNDQEKPLKRFFKKNPELKNKAVPSANRLSKFTYAILALCFVAIGLCLSPWHMMGFYVMCFTGTALLCEKLYQSRHETKTPLVSPSSTVTSIEKSLPTHKALKTTVPHATAKATANQEPIKSILRKRRL